MFKTILIQKNKDDINIHYEGDYANLCLMVYKFLEDMAVEANKQVEDVLIDVGRFRE